MPDTLLHGTIRRVGGVPPALVQEVVAGSLLNVVNEVHQARIIRGLVRRGAVEVIRQPIPASPLAPSTLCGFGVPVVIGPMNGGMNYPSGYEARQPRSARLFVGLSRRTALVLNRLMPGKRRRRRFRRPTSGRGAPFRTTRTSWNVENGVDLEIWRREGGGVEADAVLLLARRPETRRKMGENGLRKVRSRFDWDKKIDAVLEIYRAAAGKGVVK